VPGRAFSFGLNAINPLGLELVEKKGFEVMSLLSLAESRGRVRMRYVWNEIAEDGGWENWKQKKTLGCGVWMEGEMGERR